MEGRPPRPPARPALTTVHGDDRPVVLGEAGEARRVLRRRAVERRLVHLRLLHRGRDACVGSAGGHRARHGRSAPTAPTSSPLFPPRACGRGAGGPTLQTEQTEAQSREGGCSEPEDRPRPRPARARPEEPACPSPSACTPLLPPSARESCRRRRAPQKCRARGPAPHLELDLREVEPEGDVLRNYF